MEKNLLQLAFELEGLALWPLCAFAFVLYYRYKNASTLAIFAGMAIMAIAQLRIFPTIMRYIVGDSVIKEDFQSFMFFHFLLQAIFLTGLVSSVIGFGVFARRIKRANADQQHRVV